MSDFLGPTSHSFISQRTRLHYLDWGNHDAPPLLLVHGGRDHARTWDWTAEVLRKDYHVIAPDLRGHGDSDWSSDGGYSIASHVFDIAQLVTHLGFDKVAIVAHSLGGNICLRYTSLFPEKVTRLLSIEGSGNLPPDMKARWSLPPQERLLDWIDGRRKVAARPPYRYPNLTEAIARMREANPDLSDAQVHHLATHAVRRNEDGTFSWKYDPYIRHGLPVDISDEQLMQLWSQITCPVLLAWGTRSWAADPARDGSLEAFQNARTAAFEGGHWLHHDCFDAFIERARLFLATGE
ncbi:alpha/beta hydrolase [Sphingobium sp. Sx8-8]|uniref:alpha/beta fold hydrolase n=1 Tax=Sphingobium sp. Sx8-8 TaxID=2933617 RepID=UPI001F592322|nr:alpha/beta hydrolase [Sphingobium sp. Sx8-8]